MRHLLLLRRHHAHLPHGDVTNLCLCDVTGAEEGQGAQRRPHVDDGEGGDHFRVRMDALLRHGRTGGAWAGLFTTIVVFFYNILYCDLGNFFKAINKNLLVF